MTCPTPIELARAASGEDDAALEHAADCPRCGAVVDDAQLLRALAAVTAPPPLTAHRRRALADAVMAQADAEPPVGVSRRPLVAVALFAAAATLAAMWLSTPRGSRLGDTVAIAPTPTPTPTPTPSPTPTPTPSPSPTPSVTAVAADYDEITTPSEHRLVLRAGQLTIDGSRAPELPVHVIASNAEVRAVDARFEARGTRGALRTVRVFAGSIEITAPGRKVVTIASGETWTFELPRPAAVAAPAVAAVGHFGTGWLLLRAGRFGEAAAELELAQGEPGVEEDAAYWTAVAWARAGDQGRAGRGFEHFLTAHPGSPRAGEAHLALARILIDRGAIAAAGIHLDAAARDADPRVRAAAARLR